MLPLWGALLAGTAYGLPVGPVFVVALHRIRKRGVRSALAIWAGAFLSDLVLLALGMSSAAVVKAFLYTPSVSRFLGITAGLVLLVLGVSLLRSKPNPVKMGLEVEGKIFPGTYRVSDFMAGFSFNTINIGNVLFWLGLAAAYPGWSGPLLAIVGLAPTFALKHWLCVEMARRLRPLWMMRVMRTAGLLMIALGGFSMYQTLM
ncbi:MAG: LysE family transporter [Saprospiraceae bacterium]|nr:LysE family transporter [Saprospiraceae bacterium]